MAVDLRSRSLSESDENEHSLGEADEESGNVETL